MTRFNTMATPSLAMLRGILLLVLYFAVINGCFSQVGIGVKLGGNLSAADAVSFRSSKRIGFQLGAVASYHFRSNMAIQVEPTFNLTRLRANAETSHEPTGIGKGNKALQFFDLPILFRLDISPKFALLAGANVNSLLNEEKYLLVNQEEAFKRGVRLGYTVGVELGKFYFRYLGFDRQTNIHRSWTATIHQYQVGIKWDIL